MHDKKKNETTKNDMGQKVKAGIDTVSAGVANAAEKTKDAVVDAAHKVKEVAGSAAHKVKEVVESAAHKAKDTTDDAAIEVGEKLEKTGRDGKRATH